MHVSKIISVLLTVFVSMFAAGGAAWMGPADPAVQPDTVNVPFAVHGHAVDSGKGDGRSYYYIVFAEQMRQVHELEVTFTHEGSHGVWAVGNDGKTIKVGNGVLEKGTHQIPVTEDMVCLEFNLFTDEVPSLELKVPGGMTVPNTPYAGHYLTVVGDSLSAAYDWKSTGDDPDAYSMASQWWYAAAREFGMNLLMNSSVSSSGVYLESTQGHLDSGLQRCTALHTAAQEPDDIFVLLGANDLLNGRTAQEMAVGYRSMVQAMQKRYPKANIVLFAYPHGGSVKAYELYVEKIDELNAVIRAAAKECGVGFVDLSVCPFTADNIRQYLRNPNDIHFNRSGQALIGQEAVRGLYALAAGEAAPAAK